MGRRATSAYAVFRNAFTNKRAGDVADAGRAWSDVKDRIEAAGHDVHRLSVQMSGDEARISVPVSDTRSKVVARVTITPGERTKYKVKVSKARQVAKVPTQYEYFRALYLRMSGGDLIGAGQTWTRIKEQAARQGYSSQRLFVRDGGWNRMLVYAAGPTPRWVMTVVV